MAVRAGWSGAGRRVLVGSVVVLAVLVAGVGVLTWPPDGSSGTSTDAAVAPAAPARRDAAESPGGPGPGSVGEPGSGYAADRAAAAPAGDVAQQGVPVGGVSRSLVRTAQLTVDVDDATGRTRQVRTTATAAGGLVVEEQTTDGGSWLVLRVPADALDRVLDDIAGLGRVTGRSSQVVDTTEEVVDLDARVASQQASVARVRTLLAQAVSIGDVVAVESELARREADLDSLTGRLAALRDQVALSTLTVDLRSPATPVVGGDERAAGFLDGLTTGWRGLLALGSAVAAVLGFLLPFLPVLAVLVGIGRLAHRLARSRRAPAAGAGGPAAPPAGA